MTVQEQNFQYFKSVLPDLLKTHLGEYVVIHESHVVNYYKDRSTALTESVKSLELGTFLVQKIADEYNTPTVVSNKMAFA